MRRKIQPNRRASPYYLLFLLAIVGDVIHVSDAFTTITHTQARPRFAANVQLSYSRNDSDNDDFDLDVLKARLQELRVKLLEDEFKLPPHPSLTPNEFISELLAALWNNADPLPDSGFRALLRASTPSWKGELYKAIGAPDGADEEVVASALGEAMARPNNQFALLVAEAEQYVVTFPTEPVDYFDGTCWIECQLRDEKTNELLVDLGWSLEKSPEGAWAVDRIDWQDFRDDFRPGIGREEWVRVCG